jgi:hypothetical protein
MRPLPEPIAAMIRLQASVNKLLMEAFAEQSKAVPARADGQSYRGGGIRALQPRKMKSE